ncbi:hypothetical protein DFH09DRAFT_1070393 [Mycena vulgaris]|nr:hypothetical protein DFH09DRAFT_1070393 [Mycena vulgaris]
MTVMVEFQRWSFKAFRPKLSPLADGLATAGLVPRQPHGRIPRPVVSVSPCYFEWPFTRKRAVTGSPFTGQAVAYPYRSYGPIRLSGFRFSVVIYAFYPIEWKRVDLFLNLLAYAEESQHKFSSDLKSTLHLSLPALETLHADWTKCAADPLYIDFAAALEQSCNPLQVPITIQAFG